MVPLIAQRKALLRPHYHVLLPSHQRAHGEIEQTMKQDARRANLLTTSLNFGVPGRDEKGLPPSAGVLFPLLLNPKGIFRSEYEVIVDCEF